MNLHTFCITALLAITAHILPAAATTFPNNPNVPFSKYGQIQNVQNYSSNPFWNPNSPYNQRMPQPIYAQGADLSTSDCQAVVAALVQSFCSNRNHCLDDRLEDIRPTLTVQLASLPNHNYVGSCIGYIDTEFETYRTTHSAAAGTGYAAFPTATMPNPNATGSEFKLENPLAPGDATWNGVEWEHEMDMRKQELKNLQAQNGAGGERLYKSDFPTTASDLTFGERMANAATGYEAYKDKSAYEQINVADIDDFNTYATTSSGAPGDSSSTATGGDADKKPNGGTAVAPIVSETGATTAYIDQLAMDNNPGGRTAGSAFTAALAAGGAGFVSGALATSWTGPWAIASGVVSAVGAAAAALLSDSDVLVDPVTGQRTGCNVLYEAADRKVDTGGFMFCGQYKVDANGNAELTGYVPGYARQCMQNKRKPTNQANSTWGWILKDFWNKDCVVRLCDNTPNPPADPNAVTWTPDPNNICWSWTANK